MIAMHPAYEVHRHRENGEVFSIAVLGRLPETEGLALAQQYAENLHLACPARFPRPTSKMRRPEETQRRDPASFGRSSFRRAFKHEQSLPMIDAAMMRARPLMVLREALASVSTMRRVMAGLGFARRGVNEVA
jgi:hypothetical protein